MSIIHKWVGKPYTGQRYRTRAQAMKYSTVLGSTVVRVSFNFETVWIVWFPGDEITTLFTNEGKKLIGYNDPYMGPHNGGDTELFCRALIEREIEAQRPASPGKGEK